MFSNPPPPTPREYADFVSAAIGEGSRWPGFPADTQVSVSADLFECTYAVQLSSAEVGFAYEVRLAREAVDDSYASAQEAFMYAVDTAYRQYMQAYPLTEPDSFIKEFIEPCTAPSTESSHASKPKSKKEVRLRLHMKQETTALKLGESRRKMKLIAKH